MLLQLAVEAGAGDAEFHGGAPTVALAGGQCTLQGAALGLGESLRQRLQRQFFARRRLAWQDSAWRA